MRIGIENSVESIYAVMQRQNVSIDRPSLCKCSPSPAGRRCSSGVECAAMAHNSSRSVDWLPFEWAKRAGGFAGYLKLPMLPIWGCIVFVVLAFWNVNCNTMLSGPGRQTNCFRAIFSAQNFFIFHSLYFFFFLIYEHI